MIIDLSVPIGNGTIRESTQDLISTVLRTLSLNPDQCQPGSVYAEVCAELWLRFGGTPRPLGRYDNYVMELQAALTYADGILFKLGDRDTPEEVVTLVQAALSRVPDSPIRVQIPDRLAAYFLLMAAQGHDGD